MAALAVCVFCGSSDLVAARYLDFARDVGAAFGRRGLRLVYGGARVGMMGVLADATRAHGGTVLGVIPRGLEARELAHTGIDDLRVVDTLAERKAMMAENSDAFLTLPGGFGTMDELFEVATWRQIHLHSKRIALANLGGYYDPLLAWIERAGREGFVPAHVRDAIEVLGGLDTVEAWLDALGG